MKLATNKKDAEPATRWPLSDKGKLLVAALTERGAYVESVDRMAGGWALLATWSEDADDVVETTQLSAETAVFAEARTSPIQSPAVVPVTVVLASGKRRVVEDADDARIDGAFFLVTKWYQPRQRADTVLSLLATDVVEARIDSERGEMRIVRGAARQGVL
jgi:hypothetical protein